MSSEDFRQILVRSESGKAERLFRAAITAYCSLTRPSRRETVQLDDLALPLFESTSPELRRFAAAALSECAQAPDGLVRRLADEAVEISAPLLIRSSALADIDLIALIGRHGAPHARAIARRPNLHQTIADLIRAILTPQERSLSLVETVSPAPIERQPAPGARAEQTREALRAIMVSAQPREIPAAPASAKVNWSRSSYDKLRTTAFTGTLALFRTALADALGIELRQAVGLTQPDSYAQALIALRSLDLTAEEAFAIVGAIYPSLFGHAEAIRLFFSRFESLHRDAAREKLRRWLIETSVVAPQERHGLEKRAVRAS